MLNSPLVLPVFFQGIRTGTYTNATDSCFCIRKSMENLYVKSVFYNQFSI